MLGYFCAAACLYALPIALAVSAVCFALVFLGPVDPLKAMLPPDASLELIEKLKADYGFDKPVPVQFAQVGVARGAGRPRRVARHRPAGARGDRPRHLQHLRAGVLRLRASASRSALALGFVAGYFNGTWIDRVVTAFAVTGVSVPHYWLGMVLVILFSVVLNWLPAMGMGAERLGRLGLGLGAHPLRHPAGDHAVGDPDRDHRAHRARAGRRHPVARVRLGAASPRASTIAACSATW